MTQNNTLVHCGSQCDVIDSNGTTHYNLDYVSIWYFYRKLAIETILLTISTFICVVFHCSSSGTDDAKNMSHHFIMLQFRKIIYFLFIFWIGLSLCIVLVNILMNLFGYYLGHNSYVEEDFGNMARILTIQLYLILRAKILLIIIWSIIFPTLNYAINFFVILLILHRLVVTKVTNSTFIKWIIIDKLKLTVRLVYLLSIMINLLHTCSFYFYVKNNSFFVGAIIALFPLVLDIAALLVTLLYFSIYKKLQHMASMTNRNYDKENRRVLYQMIPMTVHFLIIIPLTILSLFFGSVYYEIFVPIRILYGSFEREEQARFFILAYTNSMNMLVNSYLCIFALPISFIMSSPSRRKAIRNLFRCQRKNKTSNVMLQQRRTTISVQPKTSKITH